MRVIVCPAQGGGSSIGSLDDLLYGINVILSSDSKFIGSIFTSSKIPFHKFTRLLAALIPKGTTSSHLFDTM